MATRAKRSKTGGGEEAAQPGKAPAAHHKAHADADTIANMLRR